MTPGLLETKCLRNLSDLDSNDSVSLHLEDLLAHSLVDQYPKQTPMAITGENLAKKYGITRQQADDYALMSQQRWAAGA